jgi:hypothetical protein
MSLVTIRGQLGSGAPEIGRQIADKLRAGYVDREIIAAVAGRLRRQEQDVIAKEMPSTSISGRITDALEQCSYLDVGSDGFYLATPEMPLDNIRYLKALESVIRELVQTQPLVIRGRGSHFILKDYPRTLHVLVVSPIEVRKKRVMQSLRLGLETAEKEIARHDKSSRQFIKKYFKAELEDPQCYDLVINTEKLNFEAAASIVVNALPFKD